MERWSRRAVSPAHRESGYAKMARRLSSQAPYLGSIAAPGAAALLWLALGGLPQQAEDVLGAGTLGECLLGLADQLLHLS